MGTKTKTILIALAITSVAGCNKEVECQTCSDEHPIGNIFKNECKTPWEPMSDINPCNKYELKIDSLQKEIMEIGWKLDSMTLVHDYNFAFTK